MKQNYFSTLISRAAMMLFLAFCSLTAWAQDFTQDGVNYFIEGDAAYVGSSPDATGAITILDKITVSGKQYPVTKVGSSAFSNSSLTSVTIPNSVLRIELYAFYNCQELKTVTIGSGVTYIGFDAFFCSIYVDDVYMYADPEALEWNEGSCDDFRPDANTVCHVADAAPWKAKFSGIVNLRFRDPHTVPFSSSYNEATRTLTISGTEDMLDYSDLSDRPWYEYADKIEKVVIQEGVTSIGQNAFCGCRSLTSVSIPSSVYSIKYGAFESCYSITSINIPATVSSFSPEAFNYCDKLMAINIASGHPEYKTIDGNVYTKTGGTLIRFAPGKSTFDIKSDVEYIGEAAVACCNNLTSVTIPSNVKEILSNAFEGCNLKKVNMSEGLRKINGGAFAYCHELTEVTIPNSVVSAYNTPFYYCSKLKVANIGTGLQYFTPQMFFGCESLQNIYVAKDNPNIKSVGGIVVSKDGKSMELFPSGRTSAVIPEGVTEIKDCCFQNNFILTSVTLPNSLEVIGEYAFAECDNLPSITIPNNVTDIKGHAFAYCDYLKTVTFGSGLTHIGFDAFYCSYNVEDVYMYADPAALDWSEEGSCDDFMADKETVCHVFNAEACNTKWEGVVNLTFVSDLLPQVGTAELVGINLTTYYKGTDNVKVDAGTQVFKVAFNGSKLSVTEVEDRIIKAGEGVILKSKGKTIAMATTTEESSADYSDNSLDGVDVETSKPVGYNYYTLSQYQGDLVFVEIPGTKLLAHKAYLKTTSSPYAYYFDDTTGINEIGQQTTDNRQQPIYNLSGQRLNKMQKGINIVDGRKVLVK